MLIINNERKQSETIEKVFQNNSLARQLSLPKPRAHRFGAGVGAAPHAVQLHGGADGGGAVPQPHDGLPVPVGGQVQRPRMDHGQRWDNCPIFKHFMMSFPNGVHLYLSILYIISYILCIFIYYIIYNIKYIYICILSFIYEVISKAKVHAVNSKELNKFSLQVFWLRFCVFGPFFFPSPRTGL